MKREDGRELFFGMAYWKKRWVSVPFFHCPDGAITETGELARFKVTILDGQKIEPLPKRENKALEKNAASVRETIVPWLWSEEALKELCRQNDIPLNWVTDRFPRKERRKSTRRAQDPFSYSQGIWEASQGACQIERTSRCDCRDRLVSQSDLRKRG